MPVAASSLNYSLEEIIEDGAGKPHGRFFLEAVSAYGQKKTERAIRLTLTCRGLPPEKGPHSIKDFLKTFRDKIVWTFDSITTKYAQELWEREP